MTVAQILVTIGSAIAVILGFWQILDKVASKFKAEVREIVAVELIPLQQDVSKIKTEVTYNSGTSLKDMTHRIANKVGIEHPERPV